MMMIMVNAEMVLMISFIINGKNGDISGVRQAIPHDGTCVGEDGRGRDHGGEAAQQGGGGQHHDYRHHRHRHYRHQ